MERQRILVIGSDTYKADIAAVLEKHYKFEVEQATDMAVDRKHENQLNAARSWISRNSLRRLDGHLVKVIYCLDAKGRYDAAWVGAMRLVFKDLSCVAALLPSSMIRSGNDPLNGFILDLKSSIVVKTMNDGCMPKLTTCIDNLTWFKIQAVSEVTPTAWSNEKVILFGRTGAGKSTVAQMLTSGRLDPSSSCFMASSSARGVTREIGRGEGRGWHVTDTPGFGEAEGGSVSTKEATDKVKRFVQEIGGAYSHYVYVVKKDRMTVYDERLWKFFTKIFAYAEDNFSVVVTSCGNDLSLDDKLHMKKTFPKCKNFVFVNFDPIETKDTELEEENKEGRRESLRQLEDGLARIGAADKACKEGAFSYENTHLLKGKCKAAIGGAHSKAAEYLNEISASAIRYLVIKPAAAIGRYCRESEMDEEFFLLPQ